ncbi:MAG: lysine ketoglutarate reductase [Chitinophagaceae bacterium]|nr:lysine ketoglutarate reductase [Chitinophagaceae bacterium]
MPVLGIIKEGKIPPDNRVALTPAQCKWLLSHIPGLQILVQPSDNRCYKDTEYMNAGCIINHNLESADWILGIKEVRTDMLLENKTYLFFSHTCKEQPYNRKMMQALVEKKDTVIDYECLVHDDGQRIIGFGFFAGIVGAHNGVMAYGNRTKLFHLGRVHESHDYRNLIRSYFGLKLPNIKIAITGSGRVAHGLLEVMNLMDVQEVEPADYLSRQFDYPVYVHLKGANLYRHKEGREYDRQLFHHHPEQFECIFPKFSFETDILMNGTYWELGVPELFSMNDLKDPRFRIKTIADVTDDAHGSVPCNLGDGTIEHPVYGVDKITGEKTAPYLPGSIDVMAVGNLPNELPRDASHYFGEQLIKYILNDLIAGSSKIIERATILKDGELTKSYDYLREYASL